MIDPSEIRTSVYHHPRVRELMASAPLSIDQFDTAVEAARRMRAAAVASVPVSDERHRFLGMLSDREIIERCVADGQNPSAVTVGSLLQLGQPTVDPDRAADGSVLAMVLEQLLAQLPVVQHGRLVGMLTIADLAVPLIDDLDSAGFDLDDLWPGSPSSL